MRPSRLGFEIVFGHRRYRAAKLAKLAVVPCMVRELGDHQAAEFRCIENLQREDVHPLEEAEGYELLRDKHGMSVEDLAAKLGKSRAYVFARLKLLDLCLEARKAYYAGKLTASTALYVARIPDAKLQVEAIKEIGPRYKDEDPMSARQAREQIARKFMLRLADAPFDGADASLVPAAGSCVACPKRTGNQKELFADVKSTDICTDPRCFDGKLKAHGVRRVEELAAQGARILSDKESKKVFPGKSDWQLETIAGDAPFVPLEHKSYEDPKQRTYRALLKGQDFETVIARDGTGRVRELVAKSVAIKAVRAVAKGAKEKGLGASKEVLRFKEQLRKDADKAKRKRALTTAALAAVVAGAEKKEPNAGFWMMLARAAVRCIDNDGLLATIARRGLTPDKPAKGPQYKDGKKSVLFKALEGMPEPEVRGLALELIVARGAYWSFREGLAEGLAEACTLYKVDVSKLAAELRAAKAKKKARR